MCGRYYRTADKQAIAESFHASAASDDPMPPGYNIAPSTIQPVIRQGRDTGARELVGMRWGLVGFGCGIAVMHLAALRFGSAVALSLALATCVGWNLGLWWLSRRRLVR